MVCRHLHHSAPHLPRSRAGSRCTRSAPKQRSAARLDEKGNVYLYKPAVGAGDKHKAGVILQAHTIWWRRKRRICRTILSDPIRTHIEETAGCMPTTPRSAPTTAWRAMVLAVLFADDIVHPPLCCCSRWKKNRYGRRAGGARLFRKAVIC